MSDAAAILEAFWRGSLGTSSALLSGTLVRAIPLIILGVAVSIAFRGGVFNIGGEGQLLLGAIAAAVVSLHTPAGLGMAGLFIALVASAAAGGAWAGIAAWMRARFGVLEVISTIMLNFIAMNLVAYLVRGPLQEPTRVYPQTEMIAPAFRLPLLVPDTRLHMGLLLALGVSVAAWWVLRHTAAGFRLRAVGASPTAASAAGGVNVPRVSALALVVSGAIAGLAGGVEVAGVTFALYEHISPGYGFAAIAVAILARLHPLAVLGTGFLFAVFETGALGMQRDAGVPSVVASVLEAIAILIVIGLGTGAVRVRFPWRWNRRAAPPAAEAS